MTAQMFATQNGHVEVVHTFLQHGASVDLQDNVSALTQVYIMRI